MATKKMKPASAEVEPAGFARLVPTQKRSRERYEKILECAAEMIAERGSEAFRMSDIVERSGVPFGSLYQYFPDKTAIIGTLAERYNAVGRACVRQELAGVTDAAGLRPALWRIVDGYYRMFMNEPVMRDIWQATQADRALQKLDEDDSEFLAGLLLETFKRVAPRRDVATLAATARLTMTLIAAAVRHAITLKPKEAERMIALFKRMLPDNPAVLA